MTPERLAPKTRGTPLVGRTRRPATPRSKARTRLALLPRTRRTDKRSRPPPIGTIRTPRIASLSRMDRRRTPSRLTKRIPTTKTRRMRRVRRSARTRPRPSKRDQKTPRMARRTRRMPAPRPSGRIRRSKGKPIGKPPSPIARRPRTRPPARTATRPRPPLSGPAKHPGKTAICRPSRVLRARARARTPVASRRVKVRARVASRRVKVGRGWPAVSRRPGGPGEFWYPVFRHSGLG